LALVPLAVSMAAVVAGCGLFPLSWLNPTSPNRDPSPSPSAAAATPAPAESGTAGTIDDAASGFSVQLPAGWRLLEAGDDGWVSVYGSHDSDPERDVANGTIQDYAVPLPQVEDRALNLAVYVRPVPAGTTLDRLADGYESTLRGSPRFTKIERAGVDLARGSRGRAERAALDHRDLQAAVRPPRRLHHRERQSGVLPRVRVLRVDHRALRADLPCHGRLDPVRDTVRREPASGHACFRTDVTQGGSSRASGRPAPPWVAGRRSGVIRR
jgi:hypothetical protein